MSAERVRGEAGGHGTFAVPSASHPGEAWTVVWWAADGHMCRCPGHGFRGRCRHADAVTALVEAEDAADRERSRERSAAIAAELACE